MKRLLYFFFIRYLVRKGFDRWFAQSYLRRVIRELKEYNMPLKKKIWAIKHGFYPSNVDFYKFAGFNEDNFSDFLSDYEYGRSYPINNYFKIWIDDKITTKYVFQDSKFKDFMPKYYIYIERDGHYSYLMDFDESISKDSNALNNLLKKEKVLALKPLAGSLGNGFIRLEIRGDDIYANEKQLKPSDFEALKSSLKGYIVTEYCHQHSFFSKVWPLSECSLRIVMARVTDEYNGGECRCISSYARFGTKLSGGASNMGQGGVGVPFDYNTGVFGDMFYRYPKFENYQRLSFESHPDTKAKLAGVKIPNWEMVKKFIEEFTDYLSSLEYFGFDVIVTENGLKICEINSHPELYIEQIMNYPFMKDDFRSKFFGIKFSK